ncbi:MAG TPA: F0F1 ATP synthase subunit beta, partial [Anaerolineae bacterium]|nr:F0F1 ATP synthase subunit beta [Anaerolineae bacterium]
MAQNSVGYVSQVLGAVVDVKYQSEDDLPEIYDAIEVPREGQDSLVLEVQQHLGNDVVRTIAMDTTDGLRRGEKAISTGAPISVPVGPS